MRTFGYFPLNQKKRKNLGSRIFLEPSTSTEVIVATAPLTFSFPSPLGTVGRERRFRSSADRARLCEILG